MKTQEVRDQLEVLRKELRRNHEEREVLDKLIQGYEVWLRLQGASQNGIRQLTLGAAVAGAVVGTSTAPLVVTMSFRSAVLRVLKDSNGDELHVTEILARATTLGATTTAKNPVAITDLMCYSLAKSEPLIKVKPRTWKFGTPEEAEAWGRLNDPLTVRLRELSPGRAPVADRGE